MRTGLIVTIVLRRYGGGHSRGPDIRRTREGPPSHPNRVGLYAS